MRHAQQSTVCCHRSHHTKAVYCRTTTIGAYLTKLSSLTDSLPLSSLERGFRSLSITYNHNEIPLEHRVFSYNTQSNKNRAATRSFVGKSGESVLVDLEIFRKFSSNGLPSRQRQNTPKTCTNYRNIGSTSKKTADCTCVHASWARKATQPCSCSQCRGMREGQTACTVVFRLSGQHKAESLILMHLLTLHGVRYADVDKDVSLRAMNAYTGSKTPLFLNLGDSCRYVVYLTPRPL